MAVQKILETIDSLGRLHLSNILCRYTGIPITYTQTTEISSDIQCDGAIFRKWKGVYVKRDFEGEIEFAWFGAVNDGNEVAYTGTDNKVMLLLACEICSLLNKPLRIDGKYFISPISLNFENLTINISPGSYLIGGHLLGVNDRLITFPTLAKNILINGYGAFVTSPSFGEGEQRHNVNINGVYNLTINGLKSLNCGGDGYYIGNTTLPLPMKVTLRDVSTDNARRNGISLVNGIDILIINPVTENAVGTLPMAGIDVEPNNNDAEELINVRIINPTTRGNMGHGLLVSPGSLSFTRSKTMDVTIENHVSENDGGNGDRAGFAVVGTGYSFDWPFKLYGEIRYSGIIRKSGGSGFFLNSFDPSFCPKVIADVYVEDAGETGTTNRNKSGASIYSSGGSTFPNGNLELKVKVVDTRETVKHFTGVYLDNPNQPITNVDITLDWDGRSTQGTGYVQSLLSSTKGALKFLNEHTYNKSGVLSPTDVLGMSGSIINMTATGTVNLPQASLFAGQKWTIRNGSATNEAVIVVPNAVDVLPTSYSNPQGSTVLSRFNDFITLKATSEGWMVLGKEYRDRIVFGGNQPPRDVMYGSTPPTTGAWSRGDIVIKDLPSNQGNLGWTCTASGSPGAWTPFGRIGVDIDKRPSGTTAQRPTPTEAGFMYYDTTLNKPIWFKSTGVWVDATGATV